MKLAPGPAWKRGGAEGAPTEVNLYCIRLRGRRGGVVLQVLRPTARLVLRRTHHQLFRSALFVRESAQRFHANAPPP